ncbi:DNA-binding protein [Anaerobacillus alkalidiazotrophicus]|uniref:DNA-binding protein n=1 Tax=Anaerobacillus alkalidiazotrophicus TaxID=472963 RepID=A0A1S2M2V1_9BACI|nr:helix-turn-helix domain-containing protein [Anaerobacillus alkalidiazotrophicus]OIJ19008.1 DNA-binding protein [Anaerobacillus alkalidiazotrophicus]
MRKLSEYPDVLTVKDLENFLGIGRGQAYELAHTNKFHKVRIGNRILISKKSFQQWFEGTNENID